MTDVIRTSNERLRFEIWAQKEGFAVPGYDLNNGRYFDEAFHWMWFAWKSRAERHAPETSERQEMVVLRPCAIHQGMTFFATVGYRPPLREVCPGCEKWPPEVTSEKASEQRTTAEEWENAKAVMSGEMPPCECTLRDKAPSAYHNAKCPRYVADKL